MVDISQRNFSVVLKMFLKMILAKVGLSGGLEG